MSGISYDYITDYLRGLYDYNDPFLSELEKYAKRNKIPIIERESLELLTFLVNLKKPKRILELGTAIGYSAIAMSIASPTSQLVSFDIDEKNQSLARDNFKKFRIEDKVELHLKNASEMKADLKGKFDFVFIDAAKSHYREYFDQAVEFINQDAMIFSDNVLFKGLIANDDLVNRRARTLVRAMRKYLEFLTHTKGLKTSVIPIGDGVAITKVDLGEFEIEKNRIIGTGR